MIVSFTGHRPDKLGGYGLINPVRDSLLRSTLETLRELRPTHAITGMALGFDQWAGWCCWNLGIPFTAAVPFKGQELLWPKASQDSYRALLYQAAEVKYICGPEINPIEAMQVRNEWMVDHSDLLIAAWNGSKGGPANCVRFAQVVGKPIRRLAF